MNAYLLLIIGFAVLIASGEILVRGAVGIALKFRISALVVGMTVVAFGTSAPELLVSVIAALEGHPDIAIGNVVGSNLCNIALILGITSLIFPIPVQKTSLRTDWPMMMGSTILLYLFILNAVLNWWEGLIFIFLLVAFNFFIIRKSRAENLEVTDESIEKVKESNLLKSILLLAVGCAGLAFGADWLVDGASTIAQDFGISEKVIGISIVALGTSLPELTTSVIAALKKETDIAMGNLLGSNIFNILSILGITSLIKEIPINNEIISSDIYWVLGISALLLPLMLTRRKVSRIEGGLLLVCYIVYMFVLF